MSQYADAVCASMYHRGKRKSLLDGFRGGPSGTTLQIFENLEDFREPADPMICVVGWLEERVFHPH